MGFLWGWIWFKRQGFGLYRLICVHKYQHLEKHTELALLKIDRPLMISVESLLIEESRIAMTIAMSLSIAFAHEAIDSILVRLGRSCLRADSHADSSDRDAGTRLNCQTYRQRRGHDWKDARPDVSSRPKDSHQLQRSQSDERMEARPSS
jgi:hypothetical protein